MAGREERTRAFAGKTYCLHDDAAGSEGYYRSIAGITDLLLGRCPDPFRLLSHLRAAARKRSFFRKESGDRSLISCIRETVNASLSFYTRGVEEHLKNLTLSQRLDPVLATRREQYHLFMVEIELLNRIGKGAFKKSEYKFALIGHCLRDFRPCRSEPGDMEHVCKGCTKECFVRLGSVLLKKHGIQPYISMTMDLEKLFRKLKAQHESVGALGIACIPELAHGMRLCMQLGIPPVGIPLDANRCSRWMKECRESSFSLRELEALIQ